MFLSVVILAAGKGKRMASNRVKVMHLLGGLPLLERVVKTAIKLEPAAIQVVYGNGGESVKDECDYLPVNWVRQEKQLGTGHAVMQALPNCADNERVLILYGDVPLLSPETLNQLLLDTPVEGLGMLVTNVTNPHGFGRIIRDSDGCIIKIVEERDASNEERSITEINTGIMLCQAGLLKKWLPLLNNTNQQGEYYLTDVVAQAVAEGVSVHAVSTVSSQEAQGVNDLWQLAQLERYYQEEQAHKFALSGVQIRDPRRIDFRGEDIEIGRGAIIDVNVVLEGKVRIGEQVTIAPGVILKDVNIGDNVTIKANSVIEGASIEDNCDVGPFARLRPGTVLKACSRVGNFVEMKKTVLGAGSKVNHLTYLGDATIGESVNIGAGTITCNYDGVNKWETTIGDNAFIGSNSSLVAPIVVGEGATIGAGSTLSQDAPAERLTVSRSRQRSVESWKRPVKRKDDFVEQPTWQDVKIDFNAGPISSPDK